MGQLARNRPYHHGDLKAALLTQAERIWERNAVRALTLRAAARAAEVSHAAPNNHFGDLTGLLSELAALGFARFGPAIAAAMHAADEDPRARMIAMGRTYVGFARAHPGLFALMFRSERLDAARPALREAIDSARQVLRAAAMARAPTQTPTPLQHAAQAVALWSLMHGFAMLLLEGRLTVTLNALPGNPDADTLLETALTTVRSRRLKDFHMTFGSWHSRHDEDPIRIPIIGLDLRIRLPQASGGALAVIETTNALASDRHFIVTPKPTCSLGLPIRL